MVMKQTQKPFPGFKRLSFSDVFTEFTQTTRD